MAFKPMTFGLVADDGKMQTYVVKYNPAFLVGGTRPSFKDSHFGNPMVKAKNIDNLRKRICENMIMASWHEGVVEVYKPRSDCSPGHIRTGKLLGRLSIQRGRYYIWYLENTSIPRAIDQRTGKIKG